MSNIGNNASISDVRPEAELLLCCARTRLDAEQTVRIKSLLQQKLDWEYLLRAATQHGVMPLLYSHLSAICPEAVPEVYFKRLQDLFRRNTARNLFLTGELNKILRLFASHGIAAMPYKGPALAVSIYGDLALRQFSDLDILVRRDDVARASELLVALGFQPHFKLTGNQVAAFVRLGYVQLFERDNGKNVVELHWAIVPRFFSFSLQTERLFQRLTQIDLAGHQVLAPAPEDLLLILCVHGAKDMWERLEWVCGIAELVRGNQVMNWEQVLEQARELDSERMLFLGLLLAHDLLGAALPGEVWQKIEATPAVKSLAAQVRKNLFQENRPAPKVTERVSFHLRARERLRDRMRYCVRLALTTTPVDWAILPLPSSLTFLYSLLRPIRLVKKYRLSPSNVNRES